MASRHNKTHHTPPGFKVFTPAHGTVEHARLAKSEQREADWKLWGPYVSHRAWGTVREDYSEDGNAWGYLSHDHARSRAYRWNEDGLGGFCNRLQNVCMAVALWNGRDAIIKERLFGLTGKEGNHGEDVKELYYFLDGTPTHSYMKMLYKYPMVTFPYSALVEENRRRGPYAPEFEVYDALRQDLHEGRFWDVFIEYCKADEEDILCRITAYNRSPDHAELHIMPHLWFRNTWSWGGPHHEKPNLYAVGEDKVCVHHRHLGVRHWYVQSADGRSPVLVFTENESNAELLWNSPNESMFTKDSINDLVVNKDWTRVNPRRSGTKCAAILTRKVAPGGHAEVWTRFAKHIEPCKKDPFEGFAEMFTRRQRDADEFHASITPPSLSDDQRKIQRQANAGLLWSKAFYHYDVELWLDGDPILVKPPEARKHGRNHTWRHFSALDVISMPDGWEYPQFATWDLAFHCIPLAYLDIEWAKRQLSLVTREWFMHPNGALPACEWNFEGANPPVHAWATLRVYNIEKKISGKGDIEFLERIFLKLLLNFTWWVNRKDSEGDNVFAGGFLGLDNIGLFDKSVELPGGGHMDQADGTAWMAMFCINMLSIAFELALTRPTYEDLATKFFEHFVAISNASSHLGGNSVPLWDEDEGFFFDVLHLPDGKVKRLGVRSFVGLVPLFAVEVITPDMLERFPRFRRRMEWYLSYRPSSLHNMCSLTPGGPKNNVLLSLVDGNMLERILRTVLDPNEFLSEFGVRSLSKAHGSNPYSFECNGETLNVSYEPAESRNFMFGGNSNWRGPIWFPTNFLLIEALKKYHEFFGPQLKVELPTDSGRMVTLGQAADDIGRRLVRIFERDERGKRPSMGDDDLFQENRHFRDYILFHEYFHGCKGTGLGASHQTGWTALVSVLTSEVPLVRRASNENLLLRPNPSP